MHPPSNTQIERLSIAQLSFGELETLLLTKGFTRIDASADGPVVTERELKAVG